MATIQNLEFYTTPSGEIEIKSEIGVITYTQGNKDATNFLYSEIEDNYPEAHKALNVIYIGSIRNLPFFKYLCVHRFLRCNCGKYDNIKDIDGNGRFHFEFVECPLRGRDCRYNNIICNPQYRTDLSHRELEVMRLLCKGVTIQQTAEELYITEATVKKHKSNTFARKQMKTMSEFVIYANVNNIFKE